MLFIQREHPAAAIFAVFPLAFFLVHYGGFCAFHGFFLTVIFKVGDAQNVLSGTETDWWGPFVFVQMLFGVIQHLWQSRPPDLGWVLIALMTSHGISFVQHYLIGGGFLVMLLGSPLALLVVLILLKIGLDIALHNRSHQKAKKDGEATGV